jgi:GR25 family glycosyltransferase involved in LPS biosynthesis
LLKYHRIVEQNLSTALIMEDDVDWDIRIRDQLHDFALSTRALIQPLSSDSSKYADPTFPSGKSDELISIRLEDTPRTIKPSFSPYGDDWDLLWFGHCGIRFPKPDKTPHNPLGRVIQSNDVTVPEKQFIHFQWGDQDLVNGYPPHTRVVHHAAGGVCTVAYAVSQRGARRLLYELGVNKFSSAFDMMLREFCDGSNGRIHGKCLTSQPQLFQHHRPRGARKGFSDISDHGDEYNEVAYSKHIQWSSRLNFQKMLIGDTNYTDQWPAGGVDNGLPT